jgi:hypothetical protein
VAILPRNPTPLQTLIRLLVQAGIELQSLPRQDATGVARIKVETPHEVERLQRVLDTAGYPTVSSDEDSVSVLVQPRPH